MDKSNDIERICIYLVIDPKDQDDLQGHFEHWRNTLDKDAPKR